VRAVTIDPGNAASVASWDGPTGQVWVTHADLMESRVAGYLPALLAAGAFEPAHRVLDVGCGSGPTSREIARLVPEGHVTGIDVSTPLLELARARAAEQGLANLTFERADAQVAELGEARFDRVVSRNGVMFFADPVAAFTNLRRALAADGRLVLQVWQGYAANEWLAEIFEAVGVPAPPADRPGPMGLSDPERVRAILTASGFAEPRLTPLREPMAYAPDLSSAEQMASGVVATQLGELDEPARERATAALREMLRTHLGPDGAVTFDSAVWIITADAA
jgi:SAM-dependent methyltransferase